jgi:predicted MFS family arabinose efflux permease
MSFACGAIVANIYYAQPLLGTIASAMGVSETTAGAVITTCQFGYAAGLFLLVPLGDRVDRPKLIARMLTLCAAGLAACAAAPSIVVLAAAAAVVGTTAVMVQVLVPFASELADEQDRGRVVGTIVGGMLVGVLVARTVSGVVAAAAGWRAVYAIAAALTLALAVVLRKTLPRVPPKAVAGSYAALLLSVGTLVRTEPVLRVRMVYGALAMASFTGLWVTLTYLLSSDAYNYTEATIGAFGLAGLVGALAARRAGKWFDRGLGRRVTGGGWAIVLAGWLLCLAGSSSIPALLGGIVLIDAGVQGVFITSHSTLFSLRPEVRSRLNTAHMTGNFLASALGASAFAALWSGGGWSAVCAFGAIMAVAALAVWAREDG